MRRLPAMPAHAYALSWKQSRADRRDADAMLAYTRMRAKLTVRGRIAILSGIAGFTREVRA